jgi:hypothetical protein
MGGHPTTPFLVLYGPCERGLLLLRQQLCKSFSFAFAGRSSLEVHRLVHKPGKLGSGKTTASAFFQSWSVFANSFCHVRVVVGMYYIFICYYILLLPRIYYYSFVGGL